MSRAPRARSTTRPPKPCARFGYALPGLRRLLDSDVLAAYQGDPAARSVDEVLLCYPGVLAMIHRRLAHELYPAKTPEAVIQVYGARAVRWRGTFSLHTWIAFKEPGAAQYERYEVVGFGVDNGQPAIRRDRMGPDNYWFGNKPELVLDKRGPRPRR